MPASIRNLVRTTTTPRIRYNSPFTAYVVSTGTLADAPFVLPDVAASGGIEPHWTVFGDYFIVDTSLSAC